MNEWLASVTELATSAWQLVSETARSPAFYGQLGAVVLACGAAMLLSSLIRTRVRFFRTAPTDGALLPIRSILHQAQALITPALAFITLGLAVEIAATAIEQTWLIRAARGLAVVSFFYALTSRLVRNRVAKSLLTWIGVPLAVLQVFGWLDDVTIYFDRLEWSLGDIRLSLLDVLRTIVFGGLLFWLGAASNTAGKQVIRTRESWNPSTRELAAKLFEIGLFFAIFLLLLQIMGINLTALAVFGGALGIGLGFGLQQIASNFISGIIILLDRSITPGDFIELEDGRSGVLRELNMRHGILETYDGKDVMVPNELFITSSYTNWTHKDKRQRYSLRFQVAYSTDLDLLFELVREICRNHPKVLSDPELPIEFQPDAEIEAFGESGIDILVEFWMNGIDDGENRVGADLLHSIWRMIQHQGMQIPFPQREIRILGGTGADQTPV